jgi:hypothetical protein
MKGSIPGTLTLTLALTRTLYLEVERLDIFEQIGAKQLKSEAGV